MGVGVGEEVGVGVGVCMGIDIGRFWYGSDRHAVAFRFTVSDAG